MAIHRNRKVKAMINKKTITTFWNFMLRSAKKLKRVKV